MNRLLGGISLVFLAIAGFGQLSPANYSAGPISASGATCATTNACVTIHIAGENPNGVAIVVTGTFSGTLQFEVSYDNQATWTGAGNVSAAGASSIHAPLASDIRVRASSWSSGSTFVTLTTTVAGFIQTTTPGGVNFINGTVVGSGGAGNPGGVTTNLQYNNAGSFGGFADGTAHQVLHGVRTFGAVTSLDVDTSIAQTGVDINTSFQVTALHLAATNCTSTGAVAYYNGTSWICLAGNASGTQYLQETASGVPSWTTPSGSGTVTTIPDLTPLGTFTNRTTAPTWTLSTQTALFVFGNCTGSTAAPSFCALTSAMVPTLNQNTTGTASNLSGTPALPNGTTATTQTVGDNTTKLATTAFVLANASGAPAWSSITAPSGNLVLSMAGNTSIFTTTTALSQMFGWKNVTAAVVGTSQGSPVIPICGRAFHGSADVEDCMTFSELPGNGNDAAITFNIGHTGTSTGAVTTQFPGPIQSGSSASANGQLILPGQTSGQGIITVQNTAGTPTLTLGTSSGTPAVTASGPLAITTATGNITCATCATTTNGGAISGTAPVAVSAAGAISLTGATGQVPNGTTGAFTATPTLGASGTLGTLTMGNATSGTVTLSPVTGALGAVTASLPANTGTVGELNLVQTWTAAQTLALTSTSAVPLTITGTTAATNVAGATALSVTGSVGGAANSVTSPGLAGGAINLTSGAGSAGGATSGTGGVGGAVNLTGATGGAATAGSTTGAGGSIVLTPGAAGGTGTAGAPGQVQIVAPSVLAANTTPFLNITGTWNTTGVVDAGLFMNVTNTASGALSKLFDFQIGGSSIINGDKAGNLTLNGTTSGFSAFGQGSDNANATNSALIEAPAAVTSYRIQTPGAAPSNNNSAWILSNAQPSVGTFVKMQQMAVSNSTYTNATTTFSSVTSLSFAVEASTTYGMECHLYWQGSATTAGIKAQITGPASPTSVNIGFHQPLTASTYNDAVATAFSSSLGVTTAITATTNFEAVLTMALQNGSNAGTAQVQLAAEGTGTLTLNNGSYCKLQ